MQFVGCLQGLGLGKLHALLVARASAGWLLLGTVAVTAGVSVFAVESTSCRDGLGCPGDPVKLSLTGVQLGQAVVAILAVLAVSGEYSTGMIRVTLAAMPHRSAVLAAKAAMVTSLVLVAGTVGIMASGLDIQATTGVSSLPLSPWAGLGVLAAWAGGALLIGGLVLRLRGLGRWECLCR